jgi:uncharacterized protein YukE
MRSPYDAESTLDAYSSGSSGKGKTITIVLLSLLLVGAAVAATVLGKLWSDEQVKTLAMEQQLRAITTQVSSLENKNAELSSLLADKQAEMDRLREEWSTQVANLEQSHDEQLKRTYAQMNEIVFNSGKTMEYISGMETRLKAGETLSREQASQLSSVVMGIASLHEQYKKPLSEFRELNRFFNEQLAKIPADAVDPMVTAPLGKRIFKAKELKEERDQFLSDQGRRSALVEAQDQVGKAYARAQYQMSNLSLDTSRYLKELETITGDQQKSAADIAKFFEETKDVLKIHEEIMKFEPTPPVDPANPSVVPNTEVRP